MPHFYRYRGNDDDFRCKSRTPAPPVISPVTTSARLESAHVQCQGLQAELAVPSGDEKNKVSLNMLFTELDNTIKTLKSDNEKLRAEVQQLRATTNTSVVQQPLAAPQVDNSGIEQRLQGRMDSMGSQLDGLDRTVAKLTGDVGAVAGEVDNCKREQEETSRTLERVKAILEDSSSNTVAENSQQTKEETSVENGSNTQPYVIFDAVRTEDWIGQDSFLPFSKMNMNVGGGFNMDSGKFTAPISGLYYFNVNVYGAPRDPVVLSIRANEFQEVASCSGVGKASQSCIVDLDEKDTVGVYVNEKSKLVDNSSNRYSHFIGFLLKPKKT